MRTIILPDDTAQDLDRKWKGCIVAIRRNDKLLPVHISSLRRSTLAGYVSDGSMWQPITLPTDDPSLVTDLLSITRRQILGYVNLPTRALFVYHKVDRRYKQGLHHSYIGMFAPHLCRDIPDNLHSTAVIYYNLLNTEYPYYRTALEDLLSLNKLSVAINKNFALSRVHGYKPVFIFYKNKDIGIIRDGAVSVKNECFINELSELGIQASKGY